MVIFVVKEINIDDFYLELGDGFFFVFLIDDVVLFFFIGKFFFKGGYIVFEICG